ncbi:hypothetical protein ACNOYE_35355 [Nannocystaceae bacterium ST9]
MRRTTGITLAILLSACGSDPSSDESSEIGESSGAETTAGETETTAGETETASETTASETTTDDPEGAACQADLQDCPEGYKCLLRRGAADWEFVCLPVLGDQGVGEQCQHDGVVAGTDDCDVDSWCIGPFDPNGAPWDGLCYPFCVGGVCELGEDRCVGIGNLPVCAPICDPLLAGSCASSSEACIYREPEGFVCFPTGAEGAALGEPCETAVSCEAGLHCSPKVVGCDADAFCCTEYCDTTDDEDQCTAEGAVCASIGATDPAQAHVGACVIPD